MDGFEDPTPTSSSSRRHQPPRHPGPRPVASRPVRPSRDPRPARPGRTQRHPAGSRFRQAPGAGGHPGHRGQGNARIQWRRTCLTWSTKRPILAARQNKKSIFMSEFEEAVDRIIAGPERKSRLISRREKEMTAYHEAGHALVAWALPHARPGAQDFHSLPRLHGRAYLAASRRRPATCGPRTSSAT